MNRAAPLTRRILATYVRPHWPLLLGGVGANFIVSATTGILPFLIQKTADDVFPEHSDFPIWAIPLELVGVMLLRALTLFAANMCLAHLARRIVTDIQQDLCTHLLQADYTTVAGTQPGRLVSILVNDADKLGDVFDYLLFGYTRNTITLFFLLASMYYLHWQFALVLTLCGPIIFFLMRETGRWTRRETKKEFAGTGSLNANLSEMFRGIRAVKINNGEVHEYRRIKSAIGHVVYHCIRGAQAKSASGSAIELIAGVGIACVLFYAGAQSHTGALTTSVFLGFMSAVLLAYPSLRSFAYLNTGFQSGFAAAQRIFDILDIAPHIVSTPDAQPIRVRDGEIGFEHVSFSYQDGTQALKDVSFRVPAGTSCALVGASGSGKSTIFNLIPRLYDTSAGTIRIDGMDIRRVCIESLRARVSFVAQEAFVFDDTIAANIAYGLGDATQADIEAAARDVGAHDFIAPLPQGYATHLGASGLHLSGSQCQYIALARARLHDAPILLLDEPAAALDSAEAARIQTALKRLMKGRTTLIITQTPAMILHADAICVMDCGDVAEHGTHDELIARKGLYARLHKKQLARPDTGRHDKDRSG